MFNPIEKIKIPDDSYSMNNSDPETNAIEFLSKINIFLGENNSGKSRLLRSILSTKIAYSPKAPLIDNLNDTIKGIKTDFEKYFETVRIKRFQHIYDHLDQINTIEFIDDSFKLNEQFEKLNEVITNLEQNRDSSTSGVPHSRIGGNLRPIFYKHVSKIDESVNDENLIGTLKPPEFKKIYVPILRGIIPINLTEGNYVNKDVYQSRIISDYFDDLELDFEIFTGLTAYNNVKSLLLGNLNQRTSIKEYEQYLSENFFEKKPIAIIPSEDRDVLTIKIGDEKEQPIYDLGDGIQSIIVATMPLFLNKGEKVLFFIEEPEKLLHPGLQRKLIDTFLNEKGFENYQYFMTTHSNHFLDITLDYSEISIYALRKEFEEKTDEEKIPHFSIENLSHGDTSSLELLGVKNSSVFLSNCTIWVEGITDRKYIRHYLELYKKYLEDETGDGFVKYREDFNYSFVEYGGANITHWSFLDEDYDGTINVERLCGRLFLIVDKDKGKDERHQKLQDKLGNQFYRLDCREIENLLTKDVLLKVIEDYEKQEPDIQSFEENDYKDELLGKFIDDKLNHRNRKRNYGGESGTINSKTVFCNKALNHIDSWDKLSEEAQEICVKIYAFIEENNK